MSLPPLIIYMSKSRAWCYRHLMLLLLSNIYLCLEITWNIRSFTGWLTSVHGHYLGIFHCPQLCPCTYIIYHGCHRYSTMELTSYWQYIKTKPSPYPQQFARILANEEYITDWPYACIWWGWWRRSGQDQSPAGERVHHHGHHPHMTWG